MKCCLCKKEIIGYGNNALPLKKGNCCNACNSKKVIPIRLAVHFKKTERGKE